MSRPAGGLSEIAAHWSEKKDKETPGWRGRQWRFTRGDVAEPLGGVSRKRVPTRSTGLALLQPQSRSSLWPGDAGCSVSGCAKRACSEAKNQPIWVLWTNWTCKYLSLVPSGFEITVTTYSEGGNLFRAIFGQFMQPSLPSTGLLSKV